MNLRFRGAPAARRLPPDVLGMTSGLRRRLLVMLIAPLILLALLNAWFDYRSAENVAIQQDQRLVSLLPLLADSIIASPAKEGDPPVMLLAPALEEFLRSAPDSAAYAISDPDGKLLRGQEWLASMPPASTEVEIHSEEYGGVTWRIVRQRQQTVLGEVVVALADGSDPRQSWARVILIKVLLPNLVLIALAAFAIRWAVQRALKPLLELREAVENRSPRDLSAIDERASPEEVRPLVQSLNRLFGLVNAQAESQRRFIADAAHQLRTPLAGLQAQVEAWAGAAASAKRDTIELPTGEVDKLRGATRRTSQLASQLLALSRADAHGMQSQTMHAVELKPLCESILEAHLDAASAKHIDLGLDAQPVEALGHEWLLRELLGNLVDNAVKYTPAGGTVTIRCGRRGGKPYLEVEDDGPGIAPTERAHVLERFYRMRGTPGEGNGLGLAIADEIARLHQAHLELDAGAGGRGLKATLLFTG